MTAHELADKLQMDKARALLYINTVIESADMLCQQADQLADQQTTINFLEAECAALREQLK